MTFHLSLAFFVLAVVTLEGKVVNVNKIIDANGETIFLDNNDEATTSEPVTESSRCLGQPDGTVLEGGCKQFLQCWNGEVVSVACSGNYVFNREFLNCSAPDIAPSPCGNNTEWRDCSGLPDGLWADLVLNCTSFARCMGGKYQYNTRQYCPAGLVFDDWVDVCNWHPNVCPPCGTKSCPELSTTEAAVTTETTEEP